jgi:hypothetical protein
MQHASGVFFVRLLLLPGSGYHNCSVFHPPSPVTASMPGFFTQFLQIQLSRPSLVKKPNNCSVFGPVRPGNSNLCCAGSAVTAASWPNREQLFGFLTSNFQVGVGFGLRDRTSGSDLFGIGFGLGLLLLFIVKKLRTILNFWPKIKKKR